MNGQAQAGELAERKKRAYRKRPTPEFLTGEAGLDPLAQRRVLMLLSVLSGERSVTEVIEETGITRQTYYNLEERALRAMLAALAGSCRTDDDPMKSELENLRAKLSRAESGRRRLERLLMLTRKVVKKGLMTTRKTKHRRRRILTRIGESSLRGSSVPKPSVFTETITT